MFVEFSKDYYIKCEVCETLLEIKAKIFINLISFEFLSGFSQENQCKHSLIATDFRHPKKDIFRNRTDQFLNAKIASKSKQT